MRQRRLDTPSCAYRARRGRDISTNSHIPAQGECANGVFTVQHDHEIGDVCADLETPSNATSSDA